jgi:segregation and condensation protein B
MNSTSEVDSEMPFDLTNPTEPLSSSESSNGKDAHAETNEGETSRELLDDRELAAVIEALLFVSPEPLTVERLASVLTEVAKHRVGQVLNEMRAGYEREQRGLQLVEVGGGWQLVTRPEHGTWIKRLEKSKASSKLSRSALESLAIIAYKQPIVRGEIEHIRGVETSGVLRTLLERKLVRIVGRKEVPGRPIMYGTTKFFLQHFGLKDLTELPPLREFKELGESEQALLPVEENLMAVGSAELSEESGSFHPDTAEMPGESGFAEDEVVVAHSAVTPPEEG